MIAVVCSYRYSSSCRSNTNEQTCIPVQTRQTNPKPFPPLNNILNYVFSDDSSSERHNLHLATHTPLHPLPPPPPPPPDCHQQPPHNLLLLFLPPGIINGYHYKRYLLRRKHNSKSSRPASQGQSSASSRRVLGLHSHDSCLLTHTRCRFRVCIWARQAFASRYSPRDEHLEPSVVAIYR